MITLADKPKKPLSRGFFIPNSNKLNTTFVSPIKHYLCFTYKRKRHGKSI